MGQVMRRKSLLCYLGISLVIVAADQISKLLIENHLKENQSVSVIGDLLNFHFIYNQGGAMGTSVGPSWVYAILTIAALGLIIRYFTSPQSDGAFVKLSLAMILGGAVGNLIDRLRQGKVIDFIDMDIPDIGFLHLYRWFTFNIADAAITVGLILFAISILFPKKPQDNGDANMPEPQVPEV